MTTSEYRKYQETFAAFMEREGIANLSTDAEKNGEGFFSWTPCECCQRPESGTRETATGYNRTTKEIYEYAICVDCVYYAEYGQLDDTTMMNIVNDCGHAGKYGMDGEGKTKCYACCAEDDKARMIETGKAILYYCGSTMKPGRERYLYPSTNGLQDNNEPEAYYVTNWPDSLRFQIGRVKCGFHNIASKQYNFWFKGPDGATWHGVNYGDNSQIAHCKRIKG